MQLKRNHSQVEISHHTEWNITWPGTVANVLTADCSRKWDGYEMALLLLQKERRKIERVENKKKLHVQILLKSSSPGSCWTLFRLLYASGYASILISRKFRVTSQDKQHGKQIDGKMNNRLGFYKRERRECCLNWISFEKECFKSFYFMHLIANDLMTIFWECVFLSEAFKSRK